MKTADEIKKGLECCIAATCLTENGCPYRLSRRCGTGLKADALALIQQLEKDKDDLLEERELNDYLRDRVRQLEAERDALYEEVRRCFYCIHVAGVLGECDQHCESCNADCPCKECDHYNKFEWRGVQKEDSDDGKE